MTKGRKRKTPKNIHKTLLADRKRFDQSKFRHANPAVTAALLERIKEWEELERDTGEIKSEDVFREQSLTLLRDWGKNFPPIRDWPEDILTRGGVFFNVWSAAIAAHACFGQSKSRASILKKLENITDPEHWTAESFRKDDLVLVRPLFEALNENVRSEYGTRWLGGLKSALDTFIMLFAPELQHESDATWWTGSNRSRTSTERSDEVIHESHLDVLTDSLLMNTSLRMSLASFPTASAALHASQQSAGSFERSHMMISRQLDSIKQTDVLTKPHMFERVGGAVPSALLMSLTTTSAMSAAANSKNLESLGIGLEHAVNKAKEHQRLMDRFDPLGMIRKK